MSEPMGGIRRFGRKDRKARLDAIGPLFPSDDVQQEAAASDRSPQEVLPFDDLTDMSQEVSPWIEAEAIPFDDMASALEQALADSQTIDAPVGSDNAPVFGESPLRPADEAEFIDYPERFPPIRPQAPKVTPSSAPLPARRGLAPQDKVAIFFLCATVVIVAYLIILWLNPWSPLNPLPPATPFVIVTATPDYRTSGGESSSQPEREPAPQATASFTPFVFATPPPLSSDVTPAAAYPFALADTGVIYIPNSNGRGCNWSSIAGSVTGLQGEALNGYGIEVVSDGLKEKVFSGTAQTFGKGGFELFLNGAPRRAEFTVQLFSPAGAPLSEKYTVITSGECEQNVAVVNFVQKRTI